MHRISTPSTHNPYPPTPLVQQQSNASEEKYYDPSDTTIDKAFIISQIRKLLGDTEHSNGDINGEQQELPKEDTAIEESDADDKEEEELSEEEKREKEKVAAGCILWGILNIKQHTHTIFYESRSLCLSSTYTAPI